MRVICKDRKAPGSLDILRRDTAFLNWTLGAIPPDAYRVVDKYLSEWSRMLMTNDLSPKKK